MKGESIQDDVDTLGGVAGAIKGGKGNREYVYAYIAASVAKGTPYILTFDGDEATNPKGAAPATLAVYQLVIIVPELTAAAGFFWCQYKGDAEVLCDGTTDIAKDDFLELLNAETALVKDATTRSTNSVAIAQEAYTDAADALTNVYLLGDRVIIAAS